MKVFVVVFALCIVGAFAELTLRDKQKDIFREFRVACVAETGVSDDVVDKVKKGESVVFDEKLNCFSACLLKKIKIMKPDGSIDEQTVQANQPKDVSLEKFYQDINTCLAKVGKDVCETGGKIMGCLAKMKAVPFLE